MVSSASRDPALSQSDTCTEQQPNLLCIQPRLAPWRAWQMVKDREGERKEGKKGKIKEENKGGTEK